MIERDIIGGAAHLWDCIPSKAMVATGNELAELAHAKTMGLDAVGPARRRRAARRASRAWRRTLRDGVTEPARVAGRAADPRHRPARRRVHGRGRRPTTAPRRSRPTRSCSRPARGRAFPTGRTIDGERILTTRQAYPPPEIPEHLVVIGSGVTGVEFTHMFSALGLAGHADRVAPAGAAAQGPRGRGGARGRVPPPGREAAEGRARDVDRPRGRQGVRRVRRRPRRRRLARAVVHRVGAQHRGARLRRPRASRSTTAATCPATATARRTCRTSTRRATSRAGCRCRRSRRCRAARSPST